MKKLIYYVAMSLDGYIAGENDEVGDFIYLGEGVNQYLADLKSFEAVILGRKTYEFGYKFGAVPGEPSPAYPHMKHYIVSNSLTFDHPHPDVQVIKLSDVASLKSTAPTDIYLCGGGELAGDLLKHKLIDEVRVKLNPLLLGKGIKLFEGVDIPFKLSLLDQKSYPDGMLILSYRVDETP